MDNKNEIVGDADNYNKNSIYALKDEFKHNEFRLLRFWYPNGGCYRWAYVIIDSNSVAKISHHKWGTTKKKAGIITNQRRISCTIIHIELLLKIEQN